MSDEMVKRVAQAIEKSYEGRHWDLEAMAVAAIEAMREPTDRMRQAFYSLDQPGEPTPCLDGWQAMIDAALSRSP